MKARADARKRLSALAEIDASAPARIADTIRKSPGDAQLVSLVAGALASSHAAEATDALGSLLQDDLPPSARDAVLMNLALAKAPTPESAAALEDQLDGAQRSTAALALGAEAGQLGDDGAGGNAVDTLIERYDDATTIADKLLYLDALANTGSHRVLPIMQDAIHQGQSYDLACAGAFGLRRIPGDDVDDLLAALIQNGTVVIVPAIKATAYQSPPLAAAPRRLPAGLPGRQARRRHIQAVLVTWAELGKRPSM